MNTSIQISEHTKEQIVRNHIEPSYLDEISKLIKGKKDWKLVGQIFETTSKALVAIGGIVSFAAGSYNNFHLSFIAGAISTISLATLSFSSFGYKEQKKQGLELNTLLKKLKIEEVPINERNIDDNYHGASMRQSSSNSGFQGKDEGLIQKNHELWRQNVELEKELRYLNYRIEQNDINKLRERLKEYLKNPNQPSTGFNTPIEFLERRINELGDEEEKEIIIHPDNKV